MQYKGKKFIDVESLCKALGIPVARFCYFANNVPRHVRSRKIAKRDGKTRDILAPAKSLKIIQRKIKSELLQKYAYPDYVYGLGGNTLVDHANVHAGDKQLIKIDLRDFFPSIEHHRVYNMWASVFGFPPQLARLLTKLVTHEGRLQQGFPTSSHIAAIISQPFTFKLMEHCELNGLNFSQYVDDLNFSGNNIVYKDIFRLAVTSARDSGFSIKRKKTTVYSVPVGKVITGVSIFKGRTRATHKVRKKAIDAFKAFADQPKNRHLFKVVSGYKLFLNHTNPEDGRKYKALIGRVRSSQ